MATVLVLGGTGYIGFAVARHFRNEGYRVFGTARKAEQKQKLLQYEIIPVVAAEINDQSIGKYVEQASIVVDATGAKNDSLDITIKYSKPHLKKAFIYISGILAMGHSQELADENAFSPSSQLTKDRLLIEEKLQSSNAIYGITIRPGWIYGQNCGNYIESWFSKPTGPIKGVPDIRWSWCHVEDCARAVVLAGKKRTSVAGEAFLIASEEAPTYSQIRHAMARAAGYQGTLTFEPLTEEDKKGWFGTMFQNVVIRNRKAKDLLGWEHKMPPFLDEIDTYYQSFLSYKSK